MALGNVYIIEPFFLNEKSPFNSEGTLGAILYGSLHGLLRLSPRRCSLRAGVTHKPLSGRPDL